MFKKLKLALAALIIIGRQTKPKSYSSDILEIKPLTENTYTHT